MDNNFLERGPVVPDNTEDAENKESYHRYEELGGIINKKDYENALARAENTTAPDEARVREAQRIARLAEIELHNTKDAVDKRIVLYGILRNDVAPKEIKHHHSQMSDQILFAEALMMLGDTDSLDKLIKAHPNISFNYHEAEKQEYKNAA